MYIFIWGETHWSKNQLLKHKYHKYLSSNPPSTSYPPSFLKGGGVHLSKKPKKGRERGDGKIAEGEGGILKRGIL